LDEIGRMGVHPALALNPATPIEALCPFLGRFEMLLLMTVNPGFSGQKMIAGVLPKFGQAGKILSGKVLLEVDGGLTLENAHLVRRAGAQIIVAATAIFKASDYRMAIEGIRKAI
jgi:ribulose-phosphate 3-epimerase